MNLGSGGEEPDEPSGSAPKARVYVQVRQPQRQYQQVPNIAGYGGVGSLQHHLAGRGPERRGTWSAAQYC